MSILLILFGRRTPRFLPLSLLVGALLMTGLSRSLWAADLPLGSTATVDMDCALLLEEMVPMIVHVPGLERSANRISPAPMQSHLPMVPMIPSALQGEVYGPSQFTQGEWALAAREHLALCRLAQVYDQVSGSGDKVAHLCLKTQGVDLQRLVDAWALQGPWGSIHVRPEEAGELNKIAWRSWNGGILARQRMQTGEDHRKMKVRQKRWWQPTFLSERLEFDGSIAHLGSQLLQIKPRQHRLDLFQKFVRGNRLPQFLSVGETLVLLDSLMGLEPETYLIPRDTLAELYRRTDWQTLWQAEGFYRLLVFRYLTLLTQKQTSESATALRQVSGWGNLADAGDLLPLSLWRSIVGFEREWNLHEWNRAQVYDEALVRMLHHEPHFGMKVPASVQDFYTHASVRELSWNRAEQTLDAIIAARSSGWSHLAERALQQLVLPLSHGVKVKKFIDSLGARSVFEVILRTTALHGPSMTMNDDELINVVALFPVELRNELFQNLAAHVGSSGPSIFRGEPLLDLDAQMRLRRRILESGLAELPRVKRSLMVPLPLEVLLRAMSSRSTSHYRGEGFLPARHHDWLSNVLRSVRFAPAETYRWQRVLGLLPGDAPALLADVVALLDRGASAPEEWFQKWVVSL